MQTVMKTGGHITGTLSGSHNYYTGSLHPQLGKAFQFEIIIYSSVLILYEHFKNSK
jgi:hypothetical protein